jgi:hypothetical protein
MGYAEGREAGREWGEEKATARKLRRVAECTLEEEDVSYCGEDHSCYDEDCDEDGSCCDEDHGSQTDAARQVACAALDDEYARPYEVDAFWDEAAIRSWQSRGFDFFRGFQEGAAEVWEEVK